MGNVNNNNDLITSHRGLHNANHGRKQNQTDSNQHQCVGRGSAWSRGRRSGSNRDRRDWWTNVCRASSLISCNCTYSETCASLHCTLSQIPRQAIKQHVVWPLCHSIPFLAVHSVTAAICLSIICFPFCCI